MSEKKMYLYSGNCLKAEVGLETELYTDKNEKLFTGDIVALCTVNGFFHGYTAVVCDKYTTYSNGVNSFTYAEDEEDDYSYYVMGVKDADLKEWYFCRVKSYKDVVDGEKWSAYGFNYRLATPPKKET